MIGGSFEPDENNEAVQMLLHEEELGNLCTSAVSGGGADLIYRYLVEPSRGTQPPPFQKEIPKSHRPHISLHSNIHKMHDSDRLESLIADAVTQHRHRRNVTSQHSFSLLWQFQLL